MIDMGKRKHRDGKASWQVTSRDFEKVRGGPGSLMLKTGIQSLFEQPRFHLGSYQRCPLHSTSPRAVLPWRFHDVEHTPGVELTDRALVLALLLRDLETPSPLWALSPWV